MTTARKMRAVFLRLGRFKLLDLNVVDAALDLPEVASILYAQLGLNR